MPEPTERTRWWRRVFTMPNVAAVFVSIAAFVVGLMVLDTNTGALIAAIGAAALGAGAWLIVWSVKHPPDLAEALEGLRRLGTIPDVPGTPAPTVVDPTSEPAHAYQDVFTDLEAHTTGQVVLVTTAGPGQGATTVAMNLAVTATQAGRRVFLIDADTAGRGLSRYLGTGPAPGLTDLAGGSATLDVASRLWRLDGDSLLPVLPSGSPLGAQATLVDESGGVADMIDRVSERADLVLIDSPPALWEGASDVLAAHADGSVLVLTETAQPEAVLRSRSKLTNAGAPVLGYVVNRSKGGRLAPRPWLGALARFAILAVLLSVGLGMYTGGRLWASWQGVERERIDTAAARAEVAANPRPTDSSSEDDDGVVVDDEVSQEEVEENAFAPPALEGPYRSVLLIGSDEIAGASDVILLGVLPDDSGSPFLVSLPRDLYVRNNCTGGFSRINTHIKGCDSIDGPTNLALTVEEFTGISVQHYAEFDFEGFTEIIDAVGGVEICVENAVRDDKSFLDLPAGCTEADGEQTLAWVRSRKTEEYVGGSWRSVAGRSDLLRNVHQQDVLLQLFDKLKSFRSPDDLAVKVNSLTDTFTLDDGLGIGEAIGLAWVVRGFEVEDIQRIELDVKLSRTDKGQSVLINKTPFDELLWEQNPEFAQTIYDEPGTEAAGDGLSPVGR